MLQQKTKWTNHKKRVLELEIILHKIESSASGGLCQFSLGGKHEFLKDIEKLCKEAQLED